MPQSLILQVSGSHAAQFGARARKVFDGRGGSIGRSEDCDWVLSASGVSRVHAMIRLLNGFYFIEDRSTNGMLLNGAPLTKGEPSMLNDGDRLLVDSFEVEVKLADASAAAMASPPPLPTAAPPLPGYPAPPVYAAPPPPPPRAANLIEDPFDFDLLAPPPATAAAPPLPGGSLPGLGMASGAGDLIPGWDPLAGGVNELDPLSFLGSGDSSGSMLGPSQTSAPSWNHTPAMSDSFRPPTPSLPPMQSANPRSGQTLPDNWDLTMGDFAPKPKPAPPPAPPVAPPPPPAPRPVAPAPVTMAAPTVLPGAPVLPADVDQIFRVVVDGVMEVLRARAEIKNTFRLPVTIIQRSENNPLKFAPNPEEALARIMAPPSSGFLSGTAAFQDAFEDIRCHQMAMLAGIRAAFESMLQQFSPERFEQDVDGGAKRSGFMDFAGKGKYWDKYREQFEAMNRNPDDRFRRLFGEEFAKAYEEQLSRLKSARRMQQATHR